MDREWNSDLRISNRAAGTLPPAMIGETGWDVLLALSDEGRSGLTTIKLASMLSVPRAVLGRWLGWLEDGCLVAGAKDQRSGELRAVLTASGRELLDRYLAATTDFQNKICH
jgi:hypothetical protein